MQYEALDDEDSGPLLEPGPALEGLRAATRALCERVPAELAAEVADLLPDELADDARTAAPTGVGSLDDLVAEFQHRGGTDGDDDALHHAAIAVGVLCEMLPEETVEKVRGALPEEFGVLFG